MGSPQVEAGATPASATPAQVPSTAGAAAGIQRAGTPSVLQANSVSSGASAARTDVTSTAPLQGGLATRLFGSFSSAEVDIPVEVTSSASSAGVHAAQRGQEDGPPVHARIAETQPIAPVDSIIDNVGATLRTMGFPEADVVESLKRCSTVDSAVEWLLAHEK